MIADLPLAYLLPADLWPVEPILPSGSKSYFHWKYFGNLLLAVFTCRWWSHRFYGTFITAHLTEVHRSWSFVCVQKRFNEIDCVLFITFTSGGGIPLTQNVIWERCQVIFPGCFQRYGFWYLEKKNNWLLLDIEASVTCTKRISEFLVGIC